MMKIEGLRVVRGRDWKWGDQDGGEGSVGTVVGFKKEGGVGGKLSELLENLPGLGQRLGSLSDLFSESMTLSDDNEKKTGLVKVAWDCGIQADYRAGFQGCYDLLIVDDAAGGAKHLNTPCYLCGIGEIVGTRWECSDCGLNFCCSCFYQIENLHEHFNAFKRYDGDGPNSEPLTVFVNKPGKERLYLRGIFPGAEVKKGKDWSYGDEDGGQVGDVIPTPPSTLAEGKVDVKWKSDGITVTYRRGHQGKMELKAVKAAIGGRYQPEWLRVLKVITEEEEELSVNHFSVGDRVQVVTTVAEMRKKQAGHGGWTESMSKAIGQAGTVLKVNSDGDILVNFEKLDQKWCLNPTVIKKLTVFSINQIVRVRDDMNTLNAIRTQFGSDSEKVTDAMAGETGRVTKVDKGIDGGELVQLELMKESSIKPLPAMKPEWLEAIPVAFKLHEKLSKMKTKLGNLFVEAAQEGDLYLLQELHENYKVSVDVDHKSMPGLTALHLASRKGHLHLVEWLLEKKADIEKADDKGRTALYHAVKGGEEEVLQLLIKNGADKNIKTKKRGLTALQKSIAKRQTQCAEMLIDYGCDVNDQDKDGDTPLHNAVYSTKDAMVVEGAPTVFDALIKSERADISILNHKGQSVFHIAVGVGNLRIVQYFLNLENAAEFVLEKIPKKKLNAIHIACLKGYFETAKILLDYVKKLDKAWSGNGVLNSFINAKDEDDQTPLMLASLNNHYSLIELLVDNGANINLTDKDGDTAISLIMIKVGKESKSPIPTLESASIHGLYEALNSTGIIPEAMAKHPSLAAACYLISKGGDPEAGEALSKSSDTTVNTMLRSFVPDNSNTENSRTVVVHHDGDGDGDGDGDDDDDDNDEMFCTICGGSSSLVLYNCCNGKSSMFCLNCSKKISGCPCCKRTIQRPGMIIPHSPSHSIESRDSDVVPVPTPTFINALSPSVTASDESQMPDNNPPSPFYSVDSMDSDAVAVSTPTFIDLPSPSVTASDESQVSENDDDTVMEKSDSSQSSTSCDQSTSDWEEIQDESPSTSQLANTVNIRPQSSMHQHDGASEAAAGTSKDMNMEVDNAADSESSYGECPSGNNTKAKTKKQTGKKKKRSSSSEKRPEKDTFDKGEKY